MKIFLFAASLRQASLNKKLVRAAADLLRSKVEVDLAELNEFNIPLYNGDEEDKHGIPQGVLDFVERMNSAQAVIVSTPEYNGAIAGVFKNALDWASRPKNHPFSRKPFFLMGATSGGLSAVRGLWHSRVPLEAMGAYVSPDMFGLGRAHEAFNADGAFVDSKNGTRLLENLSNFVAFAEAINPKI